MADQPHWYIVVLFRRLWPSHRIKEVGRFRAYACGVADSYFTVMNQVEAHGFWDAYIDPLALERPGQIGEFEKVEQANLSLDNLPDKE